MRRFLVLILLIWMLTGLVSTPGCGCDSYATISETLGVDEYTWSKSLQGIHELQAKEAEAISGPGLVQADCSSWITDKEILLDELEEILSDCDSIKTTKDCPPECRQRAANLEKAARAADAWLRKNLAALDEIEERLGVGECVVKARDMFAAQWPEIEALFKQLEEAAKAVKS
ncbi:MAG: hypothetical protein KKF41_03360 [Actinobacteria bacterium]|nr:hypothetical protein [Actinomycetota bacterium]MBU1945060.1 hypothetical protein [Actinomycetota bacterium]MBU2686604.1 hypothetical protein [Actinomycetota bacterium]